MSLKNDIEMVKDELNSEEKFFEKAVVTERFVKKYKNLIIGALVMAVLLVSANIIYNISEKNRISNANSVLAELMKSPKSEKAAQKLKTLSPQLYDLWSYSQAIASKDSKVLEALKISPDLVVSDLASYELAQNQKSIEALNAYATQEDAIYRDLAQVQSAVLLLRSGKTSEAREKLLTINENSSLYKLAKALLHYGVK